MKIDEGNAGTKSSLTSPLVVVFLKAMINGSDKSQSGNSIFVSAIFFTEPNSQTPSEYDANGQWVKN